MPYIPHTQTDITQMLNSIGVSDIEDLFDEIPSQLRYRALDNVPDGLNEREITQLMQQRAAQDQPLVCFTGAGAYQHHIPAAVWDIATRGEFYSAYTPYQAEASQGTLQLLYEYQTMMAKLTGMEASNASLYDGASALAEAVLMAVRLYKKPCRRVLMPQTVHPLYRRVVESTVKNQAIEIVTVPYNPTTGVTDIATLEKYAETEFAALVIPQPNFFGNLEAVHELTDWAQARGALVIGVVNPLSLAVLSPVGEWGSRGADIACGEGQPLGIPLSSGGPYFGFMCCKKAHIRQMPGRIVGRTVDLEDKEGFTLTLQAREQHIRRAKATSNICTNQGLMVTAATIYMSLLGAEGLEKNAASCHANTQLLAAKLTAIPGVSSIFSGPYFHETVLRVNRPVQEVLAHLMSQGILGGYALHQDYPELGDALLICATEMRTIQEIEQYTAALKGFLA